MADRNDSDLIAVQNKMAEVNTELLISLVEERPVLWDKTIEMYKDKRRTFEAWREIFSILNDDFEKISNTDKNEFGHLVMKKWTALRDCWMKCHRRLKTWNPKSGAKPSRKYIYYDEMYFLSKVATRWNSHSNDNSTANEDEVSENRLLIARKRKEAARELRTKEIRAMKEARVVEEAIVVEETEGPEEMDVIRASEPTIVAKQTIAASTSTVDPRMLQFQLFENQEESRAMAFFRGIAPIVDKFTDDEIVDFQFEVINAVRNIQKRRNAPVVSINSNDSLEFKPNISNVHSF